MSALCRNNPEHSQFRYVINRIFTGQVVAGARMLKVLAETGHAPSQLRLPLPYLAEYLNLAERVYAPAAHYVGMARATPATGYAPTTR